MIRSIYSLLFYLAQPLVWMRLAWRARKQLEYLQHTGERYGRYRQVRPDRLLWLHAVSVGETRAAEPLIKALLARYPEHGLLLTHMTPTGRAVGTELIAKLGARLHQAYLPYDLPDASTREGEEAPLLDALMLHAPSDVLLLLVPRHPQRFDEVATAIEARGLPFKRRSSGDFPDAGTRVWLGDSMGEMAAYYALADLALIGGSLQPLGGQNLIEAAACGCPVLVGPHTFNFAQATEDALACGAARRVEDAEAAAQAASALLAPDGSGQAALTAMRQAAVEFSAAHRGATARTLELIAERLTSPRPDAPGR